MIQRLFVTKVEGRRQRNKKKFNEEKLAFET